MLNIEVNRSAEGVERYFDRELAVSDYLMKEPGTWAGHGAERLGLRGPVKRTQFVALERRINFHLAISASLAACANALTSLSAFLSTTNVETASLKACRNPAGAAAP
jgi:TrwC relaxase